MLLIAFWEGLYTVKVNTVNQSYLKYNLPHVFTRSSCYTPLARWDGRETSWHRSYTNFLFLVFDVLTHRRRKYLGKVDMWPFLWLTFTPSFIFEKAASLQISVVSQKHLTTTPFLYTVNSTISPSRSYGRT